MSSPYVSAYVIAPADCPMSYLVDRDGNVEVELGSGSVHFEMVFRREALVRFAAMAEQALAAPQPNTRSELSV